MSGKAPHYSVKGYCIFWLMAVAVCAFICFWAFSSLRGGYGAAPTPETPDGAAQSPALVLPAPEMPAFDPGKAEYLITAFSMQGIRQIGDGEPRLNLLPPGNRLTAQVIRRDASPEVLSGGQVKVTFSLDAPYAKDNPQAAAGNLEPGKDGKGDAAPFFASSAIELMPYGSGNAFVPYPTARVAALDDTEELLAQSAVVLPVSSETGCRNCHTGPWKRDGAGGISAESAGDILAVHDRRNGTRLAEAAAAGSPAACVSCHSGQGDQPNLSTAVHGFHATMKLRGAEACGLCHASAENGKTRFFRDLHAMWNFDCTSCHGVMEDHALSLLRFEAERGVASSKTRLSQLAPAAVAEAGDIKPRAPEVNLPQCAGCHDFTQKPDASSATAFNKWTETEEERFTRAYDNTGTLRCPSCHGAPHAVYPAANPAGDERDNMQPLQYQKLAAPLGKDNNCAVCHAADMEGFVHHDRVE